jgi:creatinase
VDANDQVGRGAALIREGTRICNVGARAVMDAVAEGVPEYEVALASTQAMVREIGKSFPSSS